MVHFLKNVNKIPTAMNERRNISVVLTSIQSWYVGGDEEAAYWHVIKGSDPVQVHSTVGVGIIIF
jgi:hypothetical protein